MKTTSNKKWLIVLIAVAAIGLTMAMKGSSFAQSFTPCGTHSDNYGSGYKAGQDVAMSCHQCTDDMPGEWIFDEYGDIIGVEYNVSSSTVNMTAHSCVADANGQGCQAKTFTGGYTGECPSQDVIMFE